VASRCASSWSLRARRAACAGRDRKLLRAAEADGGVPASASSSSGAEASPADLRERLGVDEFELEVFDEIGGRRQRAGGGGAIVSAFGR